MFRVAENMGQIGQMKYPQKKQCRQRLVVELAELHRASMAGSATGAGVRDDNAFSTQYIFKNR